MFAEEFRKSPANPATGKLILGGFRGGGASTAFDISRITSKAMIMRIPIGLTGANALPTLPARRAETKDKEGA
jgi:hypothetical protein